MIKQSTFEVHPWKLRETRLDLSVLAQSESLFALSNGHIGLRGNLDEGEPHGLPGTYINGFYEERPLPQAEAAYGDPAIGQAVVNVTNGKVIRLLVEDEPFDMRYGRVNDQERVLDLRAGTLERLCDWTSPGHRRIRVHSTRLVSLTQRATAAIRYSVEATDGKPVLIVLQSELVANESLPAAAPDPRAAAVVEQPLVAEQQQQSALYAMLAHSTKRSGLRMAAAMNHEISFGGKASTETDVFPDLARVRVTARLEPGQRLEIVKYVAYGWSRVRSVPALADQAAAALTAARDTGWPGLVRDQRAFLDHFWTSADVEIDGDLELQQAVRFALFHVMQASARAERRPVPAKGLTGNGYDGHCFWDTETFVLPLVTYTQPLAAADALRWRYRTLPQARARARQLNLEGAAFPWRTIHGEESSAYWPASTAAMHINADIADAVIRYLAATTDDEFERTVGLPLLIETARLWSSLANREPQGGVTIAGVTGPDEYTAIVDNNVYTNLMARRNLRAAANTAARHPEAARELGVSDDEEAEWRTLARDIIVPYDHELDVHSQDDSFTTHPVWDFDATPSDNYPLLLHYPYFELYRKQVIKQADLVLAMQLCGNSFTAEQKRRNFDYYEALTVRDSSLSACTQALMAAEVGHLDLAYDYAAEAALLDLHDTNHNTKDGLHLAALAGAWIALVGGFGGLRDHGDLSFAPRLPSALSRLRFNLLFRGACLHVDVTATEATYTVSGGSLHLTHHGEPFDVVEGSPITLPVPPAPQLPRPHQPKGREPERRSPQF